MNWKTFLTACVSAAMISFPQNIIGCGGETDPYDYYTSFFHNNLPDAKGYKPFYYTGYTFLYDENEPVSVSDLLSEEWAAYCGAPVKARDAWRFVNKFAWKDLNNLYFHIEKNQPLKIPDSVKQNGMTQYFIGQKDLEGLGYIMYAKQAEPFVTGAAVDWESPQRDSLKMAKLIRNGQQLYQVAKKEIFKQRYAYQVLRLAHYSGRYPDVIRWYDEYKLEENKSSTLLAQLCLALKAGALFRTGQNKESAYLFSKVFASTSAKRISNYLGFIWSYKKGEDRKDYLSLCKNNGEKAAMLGLFAMNSVGNELDAIREIYRIDPTNEVLEVLAVREVNKLEEKYLTPNFQRQSGGHSFNTFYVPEYSDSALSASGSELKDFAGLMHTLAREGKNPNGGLFETVAAYSAYMNRDYPLAKKYIEDAGKMDLTQKAKDQLMLTRLLVTLSEKTTIDRSFEEEVLPSVQWLQRKAKEEKPYPAGYWEVNQWSDFYRNLMTEVFAKKYHAQNDLQKEVLCMGAAEKMNSWGFYSNTASFMRDRFNSAEVEKMFGLMKSNTLNAFEKYLLANNTLSMADVIDFAGTAYLRDHQYEKAIEWFSKATDKKKITIDTDPFIELLYDQESPLPAEAKFTTTKLAFAQEMKKLLQLSQSDKANAAKHLYKYAIGLYNMTYYGHAWKLVEYYRSGSDGYHIPKDATAFKAEYYSAKMAMQYFEKAMNAATDRNFKAKCFFMIAKCSQKQLHQPQYSDYTGDNYWVKMDADNKAYFEKFKSNNYFPQFVKEYGNTPFYKEAFNSCSYLRDFVKKK
ncbi:MAG: hypothetical protein IPI66_00700 [Chitinophagaceae bacterium]|nr:hypothetical protein [Chitinophagaceae bacterium]